MNQKIFNIQMVAPGVELVLEALNELPQKRVRGLYDEILGQYSYQAQQIKKDVEGADTPAVEASAEA